MALSPHALNVAGPYALRTIGRDLLARSERGRDLLARSERANVHFRWDALSVNID